MYKRYIGLGINPKEALLFCKVNRLAYSKKFDKHDITSRTRIILLETIGDESAATMEKYLLFAYFYNRKSKDSFTESEYKYYKKLIIACGKKKLEEIFEYFSSTDACVGIKEDDTHYRIVYFTN